MHGHMNVKPCMSLNVTKFHIHIKQQTNIQSLLLFSFFQLNVHSSSKRIFQTMLTTHLRQTVLFQDLPAKISYSFLIPYGTPPWYPDSHSSSGNLAPLTKPEDLLSPSQPTYRRILPSPSSIKSALLHAFFGIQFEIIFRCRKWSLRLTF